MSWFRRGREKAPEESRSEGLDWVEGAGDQQGVRPYASAGDYPIEGQGGRRRPLGEDETGPVEAVGPASTDSSDSSDSSGTADRSGGPWDVSEVSSAEGYVDLGALWLPAQDGMELRLEVEEESGRVISATAQIGASAVQLQAFAAPRTLGIWEEISEEIASSITGQGGEADRVPGPFGPELLARVPAQGADGQVALQPARFAGVDGPRWFLRAVFHGPAAFSHEDAQPLESLVRGVVVVRGNEAMAPRELLPLTVPGAESAPEPEPTDERAPLQPFTRGPEITEVR
ncbi:DUF3710 domain-containing protein [Spongisporangium articulatum]|uniref:DUF3710 domain-containing protein n=1 Tax=Spongisporangium articulatum TaxID=3362603 RepID=A0ABW8ASC3_9ACTN